MSTQDCTEECTEKEDVCRILIVEDNDDAATFLKLAIEDRGHEVEHVRNGTEALVVAVTYRPHIVLVDICLPGLDGHYVSQKLRQSHADIFIIATTGQSRVEDLERSRAAGCDHHLVKPLDLAHVLALIENWKAHGGCHAGK
ncbi:MAG TPA: response regulator [Pirellulales bacterium]|jgi:DNA-binding response OmpR family regulator|nr:response regulator [Pirellulales bacterium]